MSAITTASSTLNPPPAQRPGDRQHWGCLHGAAQSLAIASASNIADNPSLSLVICNDTATAIRLEQELQFFCADLPVMHFPDWETLPYDSFSPHQDIVSDRLRTLVNLRTMQRGILIVPVSTLMHLLPARDYLDAYSLTLSVGARLDAKAMRQRLIDAGYRHVDTVYEHGEFAQRGAIVDIYPMGSSTPYRIDLFDDEIDSLRSFDPESQRTLDRLQAIDILPGKEYPLDSAGIALFKRQWHAHFEVDHRQCPVYQDVSQAIAPAGIEYYLPLFFQHCSTLFDYLPEDCQVFCFEGLEAASNHFWNELYARYDSRRGDRLRPILAPNELFIASEQLFANLKSYPRVIIHEQDLEIKAGHYNFDSLAPQSATIDAQADNPVAALQQQLANRDARTLFCCESAGRREALLTLFNRHAIRPQPVQSWQQFVDDNIDLAICIAPIESGLQLGESNLCVISEQLLFGQRVLQTRRRRKSQDSSDAVIKSLAELRIGAPVVHIDHGVGRYLGLENITVDGQANEFLTLEYAEGAKLYVPVSSLELISRYSGADADHAPLHRLGSDQWSKAKRRAAEKIRDVAAELLDIHAKRAARAGFRFEDPEQAYRAFAATFPFEETADQEAAIEAVLADMMAPTATDRLVCGDVGFGKTEVAMRAAFVAVHNAKQVAVLVPTTLLAQQHYESFSDRFADWPVRIEVLSRFRNAKEQESILNATAAGQVDILIGTHKLLQSSVKYRDLGLVIIDEEHRFGVRQKEQLKALRAEVDILTLTATPIPRTLNMAMSGMRDLSIIATPPAKRLSVKTFVRSWDKAVIKEAILREILRGGQVYYLHNEVSSIEATARALQELVPELRIGIGHGQMRERQLEQVMSDFYHKRFNLLLCTTIIETGIDVPTANTIIIDRADKFGLAQLHQLRGRVGRSHHQAYAYLLTPGPKNMTADAVKRLEAIASAEQLGAGFTLATHDLEIRGAGELLGEDQSGQIQNIGFSLYMDMLERAVKAIQQGRTIDLERADDASCEINLRLPALIPEEYLPDVHNRLMLYKRIASASDSHALRELQVEMIDRFGLLPDAVKNLFRCTELKQRAAALGIKRIEANQQGGRIEFREHTQVEPIALVNLIQRQPQTYKLSGATALRFEQAFDSHEQRFVFVESLLQTITPEHRKHA